MSDYTPQTRVIKADYIHSNALVRAGFGNTTESLGAEFDRWLEQHDAEVAKAECERIIKILEPVLLSYEIDIIKGENK